MSDRTPPIPTRCLQGHALPVGGHDQPCPTCTPRDIVAEAREALDGITPGPWERRVAPLPGESKVDYLAGTCADNGEPLQVIVATSPDPEYAYVVPAVTGDGPCSAVNAEFIAAAPDLVRRLVAEVERLRTVRDGLHADAIGLRAEVRDAEAEAGRSEDDAIRFLVERNRARAERDEALEAIARVRKLAASDLLVSPHELRHALNREA